MDVDAALHEIERLASVARVALLDEREGDFTTTVEELAARGRPAPHPGADVVRRLRAALGRLVVVPSQLRHLHLPGPGGRGLHLRPLPTAHLRLPAVTNRAGINQDRATSHLTRSAPL